MLVLASSVLLPKVSLFLATRRLHQQKNSVQFAIRARRMVDLLTAIDDTSSSKLLAVAATRNAAFLSETCVLSRADATSLDTTLTGLCGLSCCWITSFFITFLSSLSISSSELLLLCIFYDLSSSLLVSGSVCTVAASVYLSCSFILYLTALSILSFFLSSFAVRSLSIPAIYPTRPVLCAMRNCLSSLIVIISNAFACAMSKRCLSSS